MTTLWMESEISNRKLTDAPFAESYAVPVAAVATGIFGGLLPPPSLTALWIVAVLDALLAGWFLVYIYGWRRATVYAIIAVVFAFGAEYALISVGLLTHLAAPQLVGVAVLNLLQDFFAVACPYILSCALLPSGGVLARAFGAAVIMLRDHLRGRPVREHARLLRLQRTLLAWGESLGLAGSPLCPGRSQWECLSWLLRRPWCLRQVVQAIAKEEGFLRSGLRSCISTGNCCRRGPGLVARHGGGCSCRAAYCSRGSLFFPCEQSIWPANWSMQPSKRRPSRE